MAAFNLVPLVLNRKETPDLTTSRVRERECEEMQTEQKSRFVLGCVISQVYTKDRARERESYCETVCTLFLRRMIIIKITAENSRP